MWRDDSLVSLTPKAFETLVVLVANRGRVVEKNILLDTVWADTFVEEGTLAQNIMTLRKALGTLENGNQFIETVPRTGYRFIADVKEIISDDEIIILERRVKSQITAEQRTVSDDETVAVKQPQNGDISLRKNLSKKLIQNKPLFALMFLVGVLILAGIIFSARYFLQSGKFSSAKFNNIEVSKLTSDGNVFRAAISPDGKYLALVEKRDETQRIVVRQTDASTVIEVLPPKEQIISGLTFSPDGKQIFFTVYEKTSASTDASLVGHLYQMPMLGGTPQEVITDIDSPVAISANGRQIAFIRNYSKEQQTALIIASIDGKDEKKIVTRDWLEAFSMSGLSWSPDNRTIACAAYLKGEVGKLMDVFLIDIATGEQKILTKEKWFWVGQPAWLADGSGVAFPGWNLRSDNMADEIWFASTGGEAKKISSGINGVFSLNLTADSNSIMAVKTERLTDFSVASAPDFKQANKIMQNQTSFNRSAPGVNFASNNKIVFGATFNGNLDVWSINPDGSERKQLTTDKDADFSPVSSSDGQTIIFISNRTGWENLWWMNADGSKQEQLTDEIYVSSPGIAPDNKTVYYSCWDEKTRRHTLRKINLESRESKQITTYQTSFPRLSPDGKQIVCFFPEATNEGFKEENLKLTILSAETGKIVKQFDNQPGGSSIVEWKGNENLSYLTVEKGNTKLWELPVNGGEAHLILDAPQTSIFRFAWSTDEQSLIYEKGTQVNNAIIINFKD